MIASISQTNQIFWQLSEINMELLDVNNIRITYDPDYPDKVEIELLENGVAVEGGQFDINSFMSVIRKFYNDNY